MIDSERYYKYSMLYDLAYHDDVNGNCDGKIDITVIDSISGANVAPVRHGKWVKTNYIEVKRCSCCDTPINIFKEAHIYCSTCGARMDGGNSNG